MSLREVLYLTQGSITDDKQYTTKLFTALINIIVQVSDVCEDWDVNLDHIHAFEFVKNEWAIALMQIYEKLYRQDCKAHGNYDKEGKPVPRENTDGKKEPLGLSTPLRQLIMHFHERRIRVAPPENSVAAKGIEDLEFYIKRLGLVEDRVHFEYAPKPTEEELSGINPGRSGLKTGTRNSKFSGANEDGVEVEYIEGDKFGKKVIRTKQEITVRGGLGLQVTTLDDGKLPPLSRGSM